MLAVSIIKLKGTLSIVVYSLFFFAYAIFPSISGPLLTESPFRLWSLC